MNLSMTVGTHQHALTKLKKYFLDVMRVTTAPRQAKCLFLNMMQMKELSTGLAIFIATHPTRLSNNLEYRIGLFLLPNLVAANPANTFTGRPFPIGIW
jgi:hypothetical protein